MVCKYKVTEEAKAPLVKSENRGYVAATELFRCPQNCSVPTERHNQTDRSSKIICEFIHWHWFEI